MTNQELKNRIIARGEFSDHAHIVIGDAKIEKGKEETVVSVGIGGAKMRHLLESKWMDGGRGVHTGEHADIDLFPGQYRYVHQTVFDPLTQRIENAKD